MGDCTKLMQALSMSSLDEFRTPFRPTIAAQCVSELTAEKVSKAVRMDVCTLLCSAAAHGDQTEFFKANGRPSEEARIHEEDKKKVRQEFSQWCSGRGSNF